MPVAHEHDKNAQLSIHIKQRAERRARERAPELANDVSRMWGMGDEWNKETGTS